MLDMVAVTGKAIDVLKLVKEVGDAAPAWFLHGITLFDTESEDKFKACIWGENKFWEDDSFSYVTKIEEITDEVRDEVLRHAALQAINICLSEELIKDYGEILLNKHPKCRNAENEYLAIIKAALQERMDTFTDEMYEIY